MAVATRWPAGGHQNGEVRGPNSGCQVLMPLELLIVVTEGASANEFQGVSTRQKGKRPEFRIRTASIVKAGTADKNFVFFDAGQVASRLFGIELTPLEPSEYGFVSPGQTLRLAEGSV